MDSIIGVYQSWANATPVATIWHHFKAKQVLHVTLALNIVNNCFFPRLKNILEFWACHESFNLLSLRRVASCRNVQAQLRYIFFILFFSKTNSQIIHEGFKSFQDLRKDRETVNRYCTTVITPLLVLVLHKQGPCYLLRLQLG